MQNFLGFRCLCRMNNEKKLIVMLSIKCAACEKLVCLDYYEKFVLRH